jgi:hypothetical protein
MAEYTSQMILVALAQLFHERLGTGAEPQIRSPCTRGFARSAS